MRKVVLAGHRGHGGAWKHPGVSVHELWRSASCMCWKESDCLKIGIVRGLEGVQSKEGVIEERLLISRLVETLFVGIRLKAEMTEQAWRPAVLDLNFEISAWKLMVPRVSLVVKNETKLDTVRLILILPLDHMTFEKESKKIIFRF